MQNMSGALSTSLKFLCDDEIYTTDQPVDFSKKYSESDIPIAILEEPFEETQSPPYKTTFKIYAETDLDLPTDYSLRYAENDSDQVTISPKAPTEFVQDTIKSYYTEDTPHETPFIISTSTSMCDLRVDDKSQIKLGSSLGSKNADLQLKSENSSGLMSPKKPVNYCEEGTPGYFSRVASSGSLNSLAVTDAPKESPTKLSETTSEGKSQGSKGPRRTLKFSNEVKAVKFLDAVDYAEETPLMFSRSSSLASLDSIEQHSINDDRSSVVSDFSRLTSGLVSPSELPDSPSQTVPPSPKPPSNSSKYPQSVKREPVRTQISSIFQDGVKSFKMENTPSMCSRATSLSSLTIDETAPEMNQLSKFTSPVVKNEEPVEQESSETSDDEDILAACINIGMQNNRYSTTNQNFFKPDIVVSHSNELTNDVQKPNDITSDSLTTYCTEDTPAILSNAGSNSDLSLILGNADIIAEESESEEENDILDNNIDRISNMSMASTSNSQSDTVAVERDINLDNGNDSCSRRSSFCSSISDISYEDENLLQQCILAGMPKETSNQEEDPEEATEEEEEDDEDLEDEALLQECILQGILKNQNSAICDESESEAEDEYILAKCINAGINNNKYTEKNSPHREINGNDRQVTISSMELRPNVDDSSTDEEDEKLLRDCVNIGIEKMSEKKVVPVRKVSRTRIEEPNSSSSISSLNSCDSESLLRECILSGMPKSRQPAPPVVEEPGLSESDKAILERCILEGMRNCLISNRKRAESTSSAASTVTNNSESLTRDDQLMLRRCIMAGMAKVKRTSQQQNSAAKRSFLSESDKQFLEKCILAGMPSTRSNVRKKQSEEPPQPPCCEHCPIGQEQRAKESSAFRVARAKKSTRKCHVQLSKDTRAVNIVYVTSQILTLDKERVSSSRPYKGWI